MIYHSEPENFKQKFEVVSCFLLHEDKTLFIKRAANKPQGGTWGIPAGKKEINESPKNAIVREIKEETGVDLNIEDINYFKTLYVRYPSYDFKYNIYSSKLTTRPYIILDGNSHCDFVWLNPFDALKLDLIEDEDSCIKLFFNI